MSRAIMLFIYLLSIFHLKIYEAHYYFFNYSVLTSMWDFVNAVSNFFLLLFYVNIPPILSCIDLILTSDMWRSKFYLKMALNSLTFEKLKNESGTCAVLRKMIEITCIIVNPNNEMTISQYWTEANIYFPKEQAEKYFW